MPNDNLEQSILNSIKKQLNIGAEYEAFDQDILLLINAAFSTLHQLGVGPDEGFTIKDNTALWESFVEDPRILSNVKRYVYLEVRLGFDPPTASVLSSFEKQLEELKWRLTVAADDNEE